MGEKFTVQEPVIYLQIVLKRFFHGGFVHLLGELVRVRELEPERACTNK